jgi:hypothetical protein
MNKNKFIICQLKRCQTFELRERFSPQMAILLENLRDLVLVAWGGVGGGRRGQDLLQVFWKQVSDATNTLEMMRKPKGKKKT